MSEKKNYPVAVYDFTVAKRFTVAEVRKSLDGWAKHYVFQEEKGDSGYEHYQGRMSLIKKRREGEIKAKFFEAGGLLGEMTVSVTSNPCKTSFSYVMKKDSFVAGPYMDTDHIPVLYPHLAWYLSLPVRPWTVSAKAILEKTEWRRIPCIVDPMGNSGKSYFCDHMHYLDVAHNLPVMDSMGDIMAAAMATKHRAYTIDFPRAMSASQSKSFFAGLECLKNGIAYDKRYTYRRTNFARPNIFLFMNHFPVTEWLSEDRWDFYTIDHDTWELVRISLPEKTRAPKRKRAEIDFEEMGKIMKRMMDYQKAS